MLDVIITAAIAALPLAIIAGLVVLIRGLIQRRKTNKPGFKLD